MKKPLELIGPVECRQRIDSAIERLKKSEADMDIKITGNDACSIFEAIHSFSRSFHAIANEVAVIKAHNAKVRRRIRYQIKKQQGLIKKRLTKSEVEERRRLDRLEEDRKNAEYARYAAEHCMCSHVPPPCSFCESLTEDEVGIYDSGGVDAVVKHRRNRLEKEESNATNE